MKEKKGKKKRHSLEEKHDRRIFLKNLGKVALPAIAILGLSVSGDKQAPEGKQPHEKQKFSGGKPRQPTDCEGVCSGSCEGTCNGHYV